MSTEFKPGDQVRVIDDTNQPAYNMRLTHGEIHTVDSVNNHSRLVLEDSPGPWLPSRFEKVPTGERVEGTLTAEPAADTDDRIAAWERVAQHPIFEGSKVVEGPFIDAVIARLDELLEIAYVMPGDPDAALLDEVDAKNAVTINTLDREEIHRFIACLPADWGLIDERDGSTLSETVDQVQGALREFANPKPARCTSLKDMSDSARIQCLTPTTLPHRHRAVYAGVDVRWIDAEEYGRVEVSS